VLGQLAGTVAPLVRLPLTLLQSIEPLIENLSTVAVRALKLLDDVEDIPGRIREVLERADGLTTGVDKVVGEAADTLGSVQPAVAVLASLELEVLATITPLLYDLGLLLAGVRELDPALLDDAVAAVRSLPQLISTVEAELLPALASLEGLVPVVAQLGVHVDHLDGTVADVGALLAGIPGAARLLKRGNTPKAAQP
jgi:hypothetical protein